MSDVEDGTVAAAAGGADQLKPAAKKQRKLTEADLGGPIEDEETARRKLEDLGFDPDDIKVSRIVKYPYGDARWYSNPICHFAAAGDLKMCRYLVTRGATTTDAVTDGDDGLVFNFPMYTAAKHEQAKVIEWLYQHGAHGDVSRVTNNYGASPLLAALNPKRAPGGGDPGSTAQWLILQGAIPSDEDGNLDESFMKNAFSTLLTTWHPEHTAFRMRKRLLQWAEGIRDDHSGFTTFLQGTSSHAPERSEHDPAIRCLSGYEGIRKMIAGYVGVMTGRNLRTVRQIIGPLQKAFYWSYNREEPSNGGYKLLSVR